MARTVKAPEIRRGEILDAAERLLGAKGYEEMAISDLVAELGIAKGTVYHYFDSKQAMLEALVERMVDQIEPRALRIAGDPQLSALEKLRGQFALADRWTAAHHGLVMELLRVWYDDENAIVRRKLARVGIKRIAPLLTGIIRQGLAEGAFTTPNAEAVARMILVLRDDLGMAVAGVYLAGGGDAEVARLAEATMDAVERILGARRGALQQPWLEPLAHRDEEGKARGR